MKTALIYLLGAGRSGTTLLATVLNSHPKIQTIGEMHQFVEHLKEGKQCSCGEEVKDCPFWGNIVNDLSFDENDLERLDTILQRSESHKNIPGLLLGDVKGTDEYLKIQHDIFKSITLNVPNQVLLDSSKYIARYLLLKKGGLFNLKGVYVIRDVRGVINSFGKQVQTPKKPIATIVYYSLINFFGQILCWMDKDIVKIKYEDFVINPVLVTSQIHEHVFGEGHNNFELPKHYEMPHIIGGNRMKTSKSISIKPDVKWKANMPRDKQILYYILTLPLMLINRYKL